MREWVDGNLDAKFEGGESPNEVKARQQEALKEIMSHPEEKTVLICMHGRALAAHPVPADEQAAYRNGYLSSPKPGFI